MKGDGNRSHHAERVYGAIAEASVGGAADISLSWRRSRRLYGLDPEDDAHPDRLTDREFLERTARLEPVVALVSPVLDRLFGLIGAHGRCLALSDAEGLIVEHRVLNEDGTMFRRINLWRKAIWSESAEGTNGIGTCLAEGRRVTIDREQHFAARNTALTCIDEPLWGPDGELLAALDLSCARQDAGALEHKLLAEVLRGTAREIETILFQTANADHEIVVPNGARPGAATLIALGADGLLRGATRSARKLLNLQPDDFGRPLGSPRGENAESALEAAQRRELVKALACHEGNASAAARAHGISRATLYRKMTALGVEKPARLSQY